MATRRKKTVQLGSTQRSHAEREKRYRERIQLTRELAEESLDKGDCEPAFESLQYARVWQGLIEAENQGRTPKTKFTDKHEDSVHFALTNEIEPVVDRFKFQCLVGGAKFDGIKRRRK